MNRANFPFFAIFLIIFLFFLAIFQTSFLVFFSIFGIVPNFVLILATAYNILENPTGKMGYILASAGGFYLDVFSFDDGSFFGFNMILLFLISLLIKIFIKKYVRYQA